jgi:hypothetical protein
MNNAELLAKRFHELYEAEAAYQGYETRRESAVPWVQVPELNRRIMIAVCATILDEMSDRIVEFVRGASRPTPARDRSGEGQKKEKQQ